MNERVLVVPAELITFQGLNANYRQTAHLIHDHGRFLDRDAAEKDEHFKQVIPYIVMTCGDKVMHYCRGKGGNEDRLKGFRSIGIGGHVNPFMGNEQAPVCSFTNATDREVEEEVAVKSSHRGHAIALLNDNSTPVGRVHLGVVFQWWLNLPRVETREKSKIVDIQWSTPAELLRLGLETWTRIVLEGGVLQLC